MELDAGFLEAVEEYRVALAEYKEASDQYLMHSSAAETARRTSDELKVRIDRTVQKILEFAGGNK